MLNDFEEYEIPLENSSTVPTIWFIEQMSAPNVITKSEIKRYIGKRLVDGLDPSEFLTKDHFQKQNEEVEQESAGNGFAVACDLTFG